MDVDIKKIVRTMLDTGTYDTAMDMVLRCTFCTAPTCKRPTLSAPYLGEPKRPSGRETKMLHIRCSGSPYEVGLHIFRTLIEGDGLQKGRIEAADAMHKVGATSQAQVVQGRPARSRQAAGPLAQHIQAIG